MATRKDIARRIKRCLNIDTPWQVFSLYETPQGWHTEIECVAKTSKEFYDSIEIGDVRENWHLVWEGTVYDFARQLPVLKERCWYPDEEPKTFEVEAEEFAFERLRPRVRRRRPRKN